MKNKPTCSYNPEFAKNVDKAFKCPEHCDESRWFWMKDYFRKPINGTTNLILCEAHAGWWNDTHPYSIVQPIPRLTLELGTWRWH